MYYNEKIEDGQTFFQTTPNGTWLLVSNQTLTATIERLKAKNDFLLSVVNKLTAK